MPNTSVYRYSNCSTLAVNCYLYEFSDLTSPLANGNYSDGTNCITIAGGSGQISTIVVCGTSAYTNYIADRYSCPSGSLIATDVTVALLSTVTPNYDKFYLPSFGSGEQGTNVYKVKSIGGSAGLILDDSWADTAVQACSIVP